MELLEIKRKLDYYKNLMEQNKENSAKVMYYKKKIAALKQLRKEAK